MTAMDTLPSRGSPLFEQIHEVLWAKILNGEIQPLQRLKDLEWANKLGVSRTPVREAMRKMQQEGVLLPLSQGGYQVRAVSLDDFRGLYRCRAALEGLAVEEAAARFTKSAQRKLEILIRNVDSAIEREDLDEAFALNTLFHANLVEYSENAHLMGLCKTITRLIIFYRSALLNQAKAETKSKEDYLEGLRQNQSIHRAIVAAIAGGQGKQARKLMESHVLQAAEDMAEKLSR